MDLPLTGLRIYYSGGSLLISRIPQKLFGNYCWRLFVRQRGKKNWIIEFFRIPFPYMIAFSWESIKCFSIGLPFVMILESWVDMSCGVRTFSKFVVLFSAFQLLFFVVNSPGWWIPCRFFFVLLIKFCLIIQKERIDNVTRERNIFLVFVT